MAIVIRRTKPITVIRRSRPEERPARYGTGWPMRPGYPYNAHKPGYHVIEIQGVRHTFLWRPDNGRPMDHGWTCGTWSCSPDVMGKHDYHGECTIVYRAPPWRCPSF